LKKLWFGVLASVVFFLPVRAHAYCYGYPGPISPTYPSGNVCGTVFQRGFNGSNFYAKAATTSYVKICPAGASSSSSSCSTTSTGYYTDANGSPIQAFNFLYYRQGSTTYSNYDFYAWGVSSTVYWGSGTKPITRISIGPGLEGITLYMPPRPLDPTPVYPSGNAVGSSYTVRWKSGIDTDRSPYPVNYEVWYKYWPFGGTEPATYTPSRVNMPCQDDGGGPDANNQCSTYVAGPQPSGNWKWHVVVNLDVSSVTFPSTFFTTQSSGLYFTEP